MQDFCVCKRGGHSVALTPPPLPISSRLPRQPVIHPVCELNERNEACCPYLHTLTHTHTRMHIPHKCTQTHQFTLTSHDKPGSPCLYQYFPSIYSHQGSCLCIRVHACVCFASVCVCVRLCVAEHAFLLSPENNRQR